MYSLYNTGAMTEPLGTPAATFLGAENSPSMKTFKFSVSEKRNNQLNETCRSYFTTGGLPQISSSWRQAP
jgi:hypothetical protein